MTSITHRALIIETPLSDGSNVYAVALHRVGDDHPPVIFDCVDYQAALRLAEAIRAGVAAHTIETIETVNRTTADA